MLATEIHPPRGDKLYMYVIMNARLDRSDPRALLKYGFAVSYDDAAVKAKLARIALGDEWEE